MRASKRIAALTATAALLLSPLAAPNAQAAPEPIPPAEPILSQNDRIDYLGQPVTTQIPSQAANGVEDGVHMSYRVFKGDANSGYPAVFVATNVSTGETVFSCEVEGTDSARYLEIANDGRVYWASSNYHLYRYDPADRGCVDLGRIGDTARTASAFGMVAGPDDSMFLGIYPDSRVYQVHADGSIELLQDPVDEIAAYVHGMAYDEASDTLFVAAGGQVPRIYRIPDGGRGTPELIVSEENVPGLNSKGNFISRMDLVNGRLVGQIGLQLLVTDLDGNVEYWNAEETRTFFGHHSIAGTDENSIILSGDATEGQLMRYDIEARTMTPIEGVKIGGYLSNGIVDDSSGTPMLYGTAHASVFVANLETGEVVSNVPLEFENPTLIQKVFTGPDNTILASGYLNGLTVIDKEGDNHGDTLGTGQYESATLLDGELYIGSYGHAKLNHATSVPTDGGAPVLEGLFDGKSEAQDRPFGLAASEERGEIYMGTVAYYGNTQGGLAIYDVATGEHEWLTTEIGADENIISVAYNEHDGMVYLGSTLDGGLGSDPSDNDGGKLIVFDPETREVVDSIDPAGEPREGVTGLMVADDGRVWGVAEDVLFVHDPETGESEVKATVANRYRANTTYWAYAYLHQSPKDGKIYGSARGPLFSYDIATGEHEQIIDRGATYSAMDEDGDIYFASQAMLFRYNVEEVADPDPTTSALAPVTVAGRTANVWGTVDVPATISTQVNIPGRGWATSQTKEVEAGFYAIELTYGKHTPGDLEWRVVVRHADGRVETGEPMTQTRLKQPTAATAGTAPTGRTANVWGWVDASATKVWSEVQLPDGRWAKSQETTPRADGWYAIELTYGKHTPGVQRWRVAVEHDSGLTVRTAPVTFVRS